jgi:glucose/arabinose dehydrogenase
MPTQLRISTLALCVLATACADAAGLGDRVAPVATLTSPTPGTLDLVGSVSLTATATDSAGVSLVQFAVDGMLYSQDANAPYEATLPSTATYTTGAHVFGARARDAAGNWSPWSKAVVTFGGDVSLPQGFTQTPFAQGFGSQLTALTIAADGRLFVTEKEGAVRVVKNGALLPQPFTTLAVLSGGERGLLGVALSPVVGVTGSLYVYYTTAEGGAHNRLSRFTIFGDVAGSAEEVLVDLPPLSTAENHNGGALAFGPDGKLYLAVGDNANGTLAPLLTSPFGKILRFNADGTIPTDNPFFSQASGVNRAIWARGLRNPYTFAFQPGTGRMHINDVGLDSWEEIDLGRAGANYGWPATEGATADPAYDSPIFTYAHGGSPTLFDGDAIVGGAFYDPPTPLFGAAYAGSYFFADYGAGWIHRLDPNAPDAYAFARTGGAPTNLAVGTDGALYVTIGTRVDRIAR